MGQVTLAGFRTRMQAALGNFSYGNELVDAWINAGLQEVAGAVDFDALEARADLTFVEDTFRYSGPAGIIRPVSIGWPAEDRWLLKTGKSRMDHLKRGTPGFPQFWVWDARAVVVWPTPSAAAVGVVEMLYIQEHPALADAGDVTLFSAVWDNAVHYFGVAAAMLDLGDDERSLFWLDRATKYAGSRITDAEYGAEAITEPVKFTEDGSSLFRQRSR